MVQNILVEATLTWLIKIFKNITYGHHTFHSYDLRSPFNSLSYLKIFPLYLGDLTLILSAQT